MLFFNMRKIGSWLERTHTKAILIELSKKDKTYLTELREAIGKGSSSTIDNVLMDLYFNGLIEEEIEDKFGGRRNIWLTQKGKQIAQKLIEIDEIIKKDQHEKEISEEKN